MALKTAMDGARTWAWMEGPRSPCRAIVSLMSTKSIGCSLSFTSLCQKSHLCATMCPATKSAWYRDFVDNQILVNLRILSFANTLMVAWHT